MKILIVEDEPLISEYIEELCHSILGNKIHSIRTIHTIEEAFYYLAEHTIDLCMLDLNLNGENGYDILKKAVSGAFHTIVISAYKNQAVYAFEYGVLDFIPKPFDEERLKQAFQIYFDRSKRNQLSTKCIAVKDGSKVKIIQVNQVQYFKAIDNYVEVVLKIGKKELVDKPLYRLIQILPSNFLQIHRSYIIDINQVASFGHSGGGLYQVKLQNSESLPLSREKYRELKTAFIV